MILSKRLLNDVKCSYIIGEEQPSLINSSVFNFSRDAWWEFLGGSHGAYTAFNLVVSCTAQ